MAQSKKSPKPENKQIPVERTQLGVRLETRMVKVLKAMAEYSDLTLGELLEEIILHSFEGGSANPFNKDDLKVIADLKKVYGMTYGTHANYRFIERESRPSTA
jgi:hypothetical protein